MNNPKNRYMMKQRITTYLMIAAALLLVACEKNEPLEYENQGRVLFYEEGSSLVGIAMQITEKNYSFALGADNQTEMTAVINVRLMGRVAERDRVFRAEVVPELSTAVENTHFRLHDGVMKGGEYWSTLPVTLLRTPDMKNEAVSITLKLTPTDDLEAGVNDGTGLEYFTLYVADFLMQPPNWPTLYFSAYSNNKYQFVLDILGISDFPTESRYDAAPSEGAKFTVSQMYAFQYRLREAYAEYRLTNPPIYMDDNASVKEEISF